jgi:uncharacterized protein YecT (DUF1311 family)
VTRESLRYRRGQKGSTARQRTIVAILITVAAGSCNRENGPAAEPSASIAPAPAPQTPDSTPIAAAPCDSVETQSEMTRCWADEQRAAERRVDETMTKAVDWLRLRDQPDAVARFQDAHAAWGAYRDAHCGAIAAVYAGGSMAPMQEAHCRAELAAQRTRVLDTILADANP